MGKPATAEAIRLSAEGTWFQGGEEITHTRTVELFFKSIDRHNGKFVLTGDKAPVPVIVEDTAYFVREIERSGDSWTLTLSDGSQEDLDPATLDVGSKNQLYCRVKSGECRARFDRKVYYELMKSLEKLDGFYGLRRGNLFYPLGRDKPETGAKPPSAPEPPARKPAVRRGGKVALRPARRKTAVKPAKKSASRRSAKKTAVTVHGGHRPNPQYWPGHAAGLVTAKVSKKPSPKKSRRQGRR